MPGRAGLRQRLPVRLLQTGDVVTVTGARMRAREAAAEDGAADVVRRTADFLFPPAALASAAEEKRGRGSVDSLARSASSPALRAAGAGLLCSKHARHPDWSYDHWEPSKDGGGLRAAAAFYSDDVAALADAKPCFRACRCAKCRMPKHLLAAPSSSSPSAGTVSAGTYVGGLI